jgi:transcriptional regulator with XRE-family HTH domain
MRRYFQQINLPGKQLAKRCGVSHSQIYMARRRNVGADNAEKISGGMARILGLSEEERLELKAEIMGHPGDLLRAWFGGEVMAARMLDVSVPVAAEILDEEKSITHKSGTRALAKLREMRAPAFVVESVERRVKPPPERPPGRTTYKKRGLEVRNERAAAIFNLRLFKPKTAEAMQRSRLTRKQIYERAEIGRETLRKALYGRGGKRPAEKIARVLGEELGLSEEEREAIREELMTAPQKTF